MAIERLTLQLPVQCLAGQPLHLVLVSILYNYLDSQFTIKFFFCTAVCPLLSDLTNGDILYSSTDRGEGTTATYQCAIGYLHVPNSGLIRTCRVGGAWSGMDLTCGMYI